VTPHVALEIGEGAARLVQQDQVRVGRPPVDVRPDDVEESFLPTGERSLDLLLGPGEGDAIAEAATEGGRLADGGARSQVLELGPQPPIHRLRPGYADHVLKGPAGARPTSGAQR